MPVHATLKLPAWGWFGWVFGSSPGSVPSPSTAGFRGRARQNSVARQREGGHHVLDIGQCTKGTRVTTAQAGTQET